MEKLTSCIRNQITKTPLSTVCMIIGICLVVGFFLGRMPIVPSDFFASASSTTSNQQPTRLDQTQYPLINPLLLCNVEQRSDSVDTGLKNQVSTFIQSRISSGALEDMSVYIQEYGKGKWVGVNENKQYDPASLLKVPIMIAYYQIAEKDPGILDEKTSYNGDDQNVGEYYRSMNDIQPNKSYTIDQLIQSMIVNSDNTSLALLSSYVNKDSLFDVFTDLGLPTPPANPSLEYMSAKSYAYFFRILYNATYLERGYSEKALELLSQSHLPNGIASAVPKTVRVADKFGERTVFDQNQNIIDRELHDCGIVYSPGSPYLVCIMSRGKDFDQLAQNIHDLSALVYTSLNK